MFGFNRNYMWQYPGINLQNKNKTFLKLYKNFN